MAGPDLGYVDTSDEQLEMLHHCQTGSEETKDAFWTTSHVHLAGRYLLYKIDNSVKTPIYWKVRSVTIKETRVSYMRPFQAQTSF
jgi:hypothetical protein